MLHANAGFKTLAVTFEFAYFVARGALVNWLGHTGFSAENMCIAMGMILPKKMIRTTDFFESQLLQRGR